jgi:Ca2+-transporting ATPase
LLENGLERHRGVTSARANTTTGNITVLFDPATDLEILLQHAAAVLRGEIAPISRRPEDHHEWHRLTAQEVATHLKTSAATGLSNREAQERLSGFGPNELKPIARRSTAGIIADQFSTIPVAVLAGAVAVSVVTGALVDAAAIAAVLALNGAIGFVTESRADATIRSLSASGPHKVEVLREGEARQVPSTAVVPGDVLLLRRGTLIAADARIISQRGLLRRAFHPRPPRSGSSTSWGRGWLG